MASQKHLGKPLLPDNVAYLIQRAIVFVTGNTNKLREVKEILSEGGNPIEISSQSLESETESNISWKLRWISRRRCFCVVPEIQGTTQEVAIAKCRTAAELVHMFHPSPVRLTHDYDGTFIFT